MHGAWPRPKDDQRWLHLVGGDECFLRLLSKRLHLRGGAPPDLQVGGGGRRRRSLAVGISGGFGLHRVQGPNCNFLFSSRPLGHAARCPGSSPARRPGSKQRRKHQARSREQKRISRQQAKQKAASQQGRLISQFDSTSPFPNRSSCNAHLFFLLKLDRLIVCYIQFSFPLINCILHITCLIYLKCPTHLCKLRFSSYL